jgi:hypothetical protein
MSNIEILANVFNLIYVVGFITRNILWLRILMITAASLEITFFILFDDENLFYNIFWCSIWIAINLFQLLILIKDKLKYTLNNEELAMYNKTFNALSKINFKKLLLSGNITTFGKDEEIIRNNSSFSNLVYVIDGSVSVIKNNKKVVQLSSDSFLGELSFITNKKTNADVVSDGDVKCIVWSKENLAGLFAKNNEIEAAVKLIINNDLANKLSLSNNPY